MMLWEIGQASLVIILIMNIRKERVREQMREIPTAGEREIERTTYCRLESQTARDREREGSKNGQRAKEGRIEREIKIAKEGEREGERAREKDMKGKRCYSKTSERLL